LQKLFRCVTISRVVIIFLLFQLVTAAYSEVDVNVYLKSTHYIDSENIEIIEKTKQVTGNLNDEKSKAIAIHNFVRDEIKFGFSKSFWKQTASEVLIEKTGFCNTKTTLFIAMLRASKIPARQIFVNIDSSILDGYVDTGSDFVDHSYAEVLINGNWVKTDSYIVDTTLFNSAQKHLADQNRKIGFGTVAGATNQWDGTSNAFSQFLPDAVPNLSTANFGEYLDIKDFYSLNPNAINGSWFNRFIFNFIAGATNLKIQKIRETK
jgi:transglutaminase-like putative cysteine protease